MAQRPWVSWACCRPRRATRRSYNPQASCAGKHPVARDGARGILPTGPVFVIVARMDKVERFRSFFVEGPSDECWEWMGPTHNGYGKFGRENAHRRAWISANGPVPPGCEIHHICHNRGCVNPNHGSPIDIIAHRQIHSRKEAGVCRRGHPYNGSVNKTTGAQVCKTCELESARSRRRQKALDARMAASYALMRKHKSSPNGG